MPNTHLTICYVLISLNIRSYSRHVCIVHPIRGNALRILPTKLNLYLIYLSLFFFSHSSPLSLLPVLFVSIKLGYLFGARSWKQPKIHHRPCACAHIFIHVSEFAGVCLRRCLGGCVCVCVQWPTDLTQSLWMRYLEMCPSKHCTKSSLLHHSHIFRKKLCFF